MKTTRVIEFRAYIAGKMEYGVHTSGQFGFVKKNWKVMQYTGRDDAEINGTEVWEDDIIQNCDTKELQVVYWNEDEAAWYCRYVNDENRIVSLAESLGNLNKVVGNIYENSELLTVREENLI